MMTRQKLIWLIPQSVVRPGGCASSLALVTREVDSASRASGRRGS